MISPDQQHCFSGQREIACAQYFLCVKQQMCKCNTTCCDARTGSGQPFELHWDDGALEGTVAGAGGPLQIFLDPVPAP